MKIVFFGEDSFSTIVLESLVRAGHDVVGVFCPVYNNSIHARLLKFCETNNLYFERVKDFSSEKFIDKIVSLDPELICVCHFQKLIKKQLIQLPKFGCINLHPSLLPEYRGMAPQHWPIINGDSKTGITVHFIDEGVDTGDIILQKEVVIENDQYVFDLQNKMKPLYATIVKEAVDCIISNSRKYIMQSHLPGSYYGRFKKCDRKIDINDSCIKAYNLIRAASFPYEGAYIENYTIWKAKKIPLDDIDIENNNQNGIFANQENERFIIFKDGALKIEKYQVKQ